VLIIVDYDLVCKDQRHYYKKYTIIGRSQNISFVLIKILLRLFKAKVCAFSIYIRGFGKTDTNMALQFINLLFKCVG